MPPPSSVTLLFQHPSRKVARRPLREFLHSAAARIGGGCHLTCLITGDDQLQQLNRQFRGKDDTTDVLSFPSADGSGERHRAGSAPARERNLPPSRRDRLRCAAQISGEIAISLDAAARQAAEFGHPVEQELRILILHGLLHLAGMDHETDSGEMARAEAKWRRRLGLGAGLIERSVSPRPNRDRKGAATAQPPRP